MTERIQEIAQQARNAGVVAALRGLPRMTLADLSRVIDGSPYAEAVREVTVAALRDSTRPAPDIRLDFRKLTRPTPDIQLDFRVGERLEDTLMRAFRAYPDHRFPSGLFTKRLNIRRWTAQRVLGELVGRGLLIRSGRTGSTRYQLAAAGVGCEDA